LRTSRDNKQQISEGGELMISPGTKVYLKACYVGEPGTVLRKECSRLVVYWPDLDYLSRHPEAALVVAEEADAAEGGDRYRRSTWPLETNRTTRA
jgi:hypothetical protein